MTKKKIKIIVKPGSKGSADGMEYQSVHFCPILRVLMVELIFQILFVTIYYMYLSIIYIPNQNSENPILSVWEKNVHSGTLFHRLNFRARLQYVQNRRQSLINNKSCLYFQTKQIYQAMSFLGRAVKNENSHF